MKKVILIQICAVLLIVLTAATTAMPETNQEKILFLMKERINILNYYYGGKMAFDDARQNLTRISKNELLKEDLQTMEGFADTEIDQITDYDIEILFCEKSAYGVIKGEIHVSWVLFGHEGFWQTEEDYYFTAEIDEQGTKLTQLRIL